MSEYKWHHLKNSSKIRSLTKQMIYGPIQYLEFVSAFVISIKSSICISGFNRFWTSWECTWIGKSSYLKSVLKYKTNTNFLSIKSFFKGNEPFTN